MTQQLHIFYPRGGGGSWLDNLIWHLENRDWTVPTVNRVFDREPMSTVRFGHSFEIVDPGRPENVTVKQTNTVPSIVFSTQYRFNSYLLLAEKVWYGIHHIDQLPLTEQFFRLSDSARYILTNATYHEYYDRVDLEYSLIFQNPDRFIDCLFDILTRYGIEFTANRDYCLKSIAYYRTTCPNPEEYIGNMSNLIYLAWVHAVSQINGVELAGAIDQADSVAAIAAIVADTAEPALELARATTFYWTK